MLNGVNLNRYNVDFSDHPSPNAANGQYPSSQVLDVMDELEAIYISDEFRMFAYKIKRCSRTRSHDWTECPYAHRGEKATRRDPRKVPYVALACPGFRNGRCHKGDACEFAHGVFEYWLHPSRYRTRACNSGRFCQRKVCFFAHTPEQLRSEKKHVCPFVYRPHMRVYGGPSVVEEATGARNSPPVFGSPMRMDGGSYFEGVSEFLDSLRSLKITEGNQVKAGDKSEEVNNLQTTPDDFLPQIDWVSELIK